MPNVVGCSFGRSLGREERAEVRAATAICLTHSLSIGFLAPIFEESCMWRLVRASRYMCTLYMYATEHRSNLPLSVASSSGVNNDARKRLGESSR
jgi:hypothetical protein